MESEILWESEITPTLVTASIRRAFGGKFKTSKFQPAWHNDQSAEIEFNAIILLLNKVRTKYASLWHFLIESDHNVWLTK
jgi:hypothetical protein